MLTLQEIFDIGVRGIISQNYQKSEGPNIDDGEPNCLLRGPNNTKCHIGWLIPDDKFTYDLEGAINDKLCNIAGITTLNLRIFARKCQRIHDKFLNKNKPYIWLQKMEELADEYGLSKVALGFGP